MASLKNKGGRRGESWTINFTSKFLHLWWKDLWKVYETTDMSQYLCQISAIQSDWQVYSFTNASWQLHALQHKESYFK